MQHALLIAEKPDLMRQIQAVYNSKRASIPYEITFLSQRGHLLTLKTPAEIDEEQKDWAWENLPFIPDVWRYKVIDDKKVGNFKTSKERLDDIRTELKSRKYDFVINAGDPDQEGELLIRVVLSYLNCTLPIKRFWTNDLTPEHILNALTHLKDDRTDPMLVNLLEAAYVRQHSDYLFGMNISEAASLKMNSTVACGRVKTPLLAIVCKREEEIKNYKETTVYSIEAVYKDGFIGKLSKDNKIIWFNTQEEADELKNKLKNKATVKSYEKKEIKTYAPKLFKLATLQIEAGRLGYNDKVTLDIIQKLYEQQYLSYPRTDCEYLSSNEDFGGILSALKPFIKEPISKEAITAVKRSNRWVNDKKLEQSGHSAIRPTTRLPDLNSLSKAEKDIYSLIVNRFLSIFYPPLIQKETTLISDINGNDFLSTSKEVIQPGFTKVLNNTPKNTKIPKKSVGDILDVASFNTSTKVSEVPKRFTSPELIAICEKPQRYSETKKDFKIGTPATRSGIIRQLIDKDGYIEEVKEGNRTVLKPTLVGERIISNLGDLSICKVDMTGQWEEQLQKVRNGEKTREILEKEMIVDMTKMISDIKEKEVKELIQSITACKNCNGNIVHGKNGFYCMNCHLGIYKEFMGHKFTEKEAEDLFNGKTVSVLLKNKDGIKWNQTLRYDFENKKLEFVKEEPKETSIICPKCGEALFDKTKAYVCKCGLTFWKEQIGHKFTEKEVKKLLEGKAITTTLKKGDGTKWQQSVKYDHQNNKLEFVKNTIKESEFLCPCCNKPLKENNRAYSCDCGFILFKEICEHRLTKKETANILKMKDSGLINGLKSKKGNVFSCHIIVDTESKKTAFKFN